MGGGDVFADAPPGTVFADPDLLAETDLRRPQVVEVSDRLGVEPPALTADGFVERLTGCDRPVAETTDDEPVTEER